MKPFARSIPRFVPSGFLSSVFSSMRSRFVCRLLVTAGFFVLAAFACLHAQGTPGNLPPVALPKSIELDEDTVKTDLLQGTDPENVALKFRLTTQAEHGYVTISAGGEMTYKPSPNYSGFDTFRFVVNDGTVDSPAALVTLKINMQNDVPVALDAVYIVAPGTTFTGELGGFDVDPKATLTYEIISQPSGGTLTLLQDPKAPSGSPNDGKFGRFSFTPPTLSPPDRHGVYTFTFTIGDGSAVSPPATVTLVVGDRSGFFGDILRNRLASVLLPGATGPVTEFSPVEYGPVLDMAVDRANRRLYALSKNGLLIFDIIAEGDVPTLNLSGTGAVPDTGGTHLALSLDARTVYLASKGKVTALNLYPEGVWDSGRLIHKEPFSHRRTYAFEPADREPVALGVHPAGDRLFVVTAASGNKVNVNNDLLRSDVGNGTRSEQLSDADLPADFGFLSQLDITNPIPGTAAPAAFSSPVDIKALIHPQVSVGIKSLAFSPDGNCLFLAAVGGQTVRATSFGIMPTTDEGTGGIVVRDVRPRPDDAADGWVAYLGFIPTTVKGEDTEKLRTDIRKEGWRIVHPQVQWARNLYLTGLGQFEVSSGSPFTIQQGLTAFTLGSIVLAEMEDSFQDYGYMQAYYNLYPNDMVGASSVAINHRGDFGVVTLQETNNLGLLDVKPASSLDGYSADSRPDFFIQTGTGKTINAFEAALAGPSSATIYQWLYSQEVTFSADDSRILIGMAGGTPKSDSLNKIGSADAFTLQNANEPDNPTFRGGNPPPGFALHSTGIFQSPRQVAALQSPEGDFDHDAFSDQAEAFNRWNQQRTVPQGIKEAMVDTSAGTSPSAAPLSDPGKPILPSTFGDDALDKAFFLPASGVGYRFDRHNQHPLALNAASRGALAAIEQLGRRWHEAFLAGEIQRPYFVVGIIAQPGAGVIKNKEGEELQYATRNGFEVNFPYLSVAADGSLSDAAHDFVLSNGAASPRDNREENLAGFDALHNAKLLQLLFQEKREGRFLANRIELDPAVRFLLSEPALSDPLFAIDAETRSLAEKMNLGDTRFLYHGIRDPERPSRRDLDSQLSVSFSPLAVVITPEPPPAPGPGVPPPVPGRHTFVIKPPDYVNLETLRVLLPKLPGADLDDFLVRTADGTLLQLDKEYDYADLLDDFGRLVLTVDAVSGTDWQLALEVRSPEVDTLYSLRDRFEYIRWKDTNNPSRRLMTCEEPTAATDRQRTVVEAETIGFQSPIRYVIDKWTPEEGATLDGPPSLPVIDIQTGVVVAGDDRGTLSIIAESDAPDGATERTPPIEILVGCADCSTGDCEREGVLTTQVPERGLAFEVHDGDEGLLRFFSDDIRRDPKYLEYSYHNKDTRVLRDKDGVIRQVLTRRTLIDIVRQGDGFSVNTHARESTQTRPDYDPEEGVYLVSGQLISQLVVAPDPELGDRGAMITVHYTGASADGGAADNRTERYVYRHPDSQTWSYSEFTDAAGLRPLREIIIERGADPDSAPDASFVTRTLRDGEGVILSQTRQSLRPIAGSLRAISQVDDPAGAARRSLYEHDAAGHVSAVIRPDGSWARYVYEAGRLTKLIEPWLNAPFSAPDSACVVTTYDYTPLVPPADGVIPRPESPRTTITTTLGIETARTYAHYETHLESLIVAVRPGATWQDPANLVTTTRYVSDGFFAGRALSIRYPDGTLSLYRYELEADGRQRTTVHSGAPATDLSSIVDGTSTVSITNRQGHEILSRTTDIATGFTLDEREALQIDARGRPTLWGHLDGGTSSIVYACCGVESETDRLGITTSYQYDEFKQLRTSTRLGITTRYERDSGGRVVKTFRRGSDGVETLIARTDYLDRVGEAKDTYDAEQRKTQSRTVHNSDGTTTNTVTLPGGFTQSQTIARDGRLLEVGGTALRPMRYEYRVETFGKPGRPALPYLVTRVVALVRDESTGQYRDTEWTETWTDTAGRAFRSYDPTGAYAENEYNAKNQLCRSSDPDGVTTLFVYNQRGQLAITALDRNRNDEIDYFGNDRITSVRREYVLRDGIVVARSTTELWADSAVGVSLTAALAGSSVSAVAVTGSGAFTSPPRITFESAPEGGVTATGEAVLTDGILTGVIVTNPGSGYIVAPAVSLVLTPVSMETEDQSVDGLRSWTTQFGNTAQRERVFPAARDGSWVNKSIHADGSYDIYDYRGGRLFSSSSYDRDGVRIANVTYTYDACGRTREVTDIRTGTTSYTYYNDDQVRELKAPHPELEGQWSVTTFYYNERGFLQRHLLPDQTETFYEYTPLGLPDRVRGSQTYSLDYDYDEQGRMTGFTTWRDFAGDAGKAITSWRYHPQTGRLAAKRHADGKETSYSYTPGGRVKQRVWARDASSSAPDVPLTTSYNYNLDGILATVDYNDSTPDIGYEYYRHGMVKEVREGLLVAGAISDDNLRHRHTFSYDARLMPDVEGIATFGKYKITHRYEGDAAGELRGRYKGFSLAGPTEVIHSADYRYDAAGRLGQAVSAAGRFDYNYAPDTDLIDTLKGPAHSVQNIYQSRGNGLRVRSNLVGTTTVSRFSHTFNALGQRVTAGSEGAAFAGASHFVYRYNSKGEIVAADKFQGANPDLPGPPIQPETFAYEFDDIGNRKQATRGPSAAPLERKDYVANALNQYTGISGFSPELSSFSVEPSYDREGNLTGDDRWLYFWDGENRLIRMETRPEVVAVSGQPASRLDFTYDYQGRRVRKQVFTASGGGAWALVTDLGFLYDGWSLIAEMDCSAQPARLIRAYTWGADRSGSLHGAGGVGGLLGVTEAPSAPGSMVRSFFPTYDTNGNISEYLDESGTVVAHFEYGPFGEIVRSTGTFVAPFGFSTKYRDVETDLIYYGYRYYDSDAGRWLSRDPIQESGGVNMYGFLDNDAVQSVDLNGLCDLSPIIDLLKQKVINELEERVIKVALKKAAKTSILKGVLFFIDGPFPIGDAISVAWMAADAASLASQVSKYKDYAKSIMDGLTQLKGIKGLGDMDPTTHCCDDLLTQTGRLVKTGVASNKGFTVAMIKKGVAAIRTALKQCVCDCVNDLDPRKWNNPDFVGDEHAQAPGEELTVERGVDARKRHGRADRKEELAHAILNLPEDHPLYAQRMALAEEAFRTGKTPKGYVQAHDESSPAREGYGYSGKNSKLDTKQKNDRDEANRKALFSATKKRFGKLYDTLCK